MLYPSNNNVYCHCCSNQLLISLIVIFMFFSLNWVITWEKQSPCVHFKMFDRLKCGCQCKKPVFHWRWSVFLEQQGMTVYLMWSNLVFTIYYMAHLLNPSFVGLSVLAGKSMQGLHHHEHQHHPDHLIHSTDNNPLYVFSHSELFITRQDREK